MRSTGEIYDLRFVSVHFIASATTHHARIAFQARVRFTMRSFRPIYARDLSDVNFNKEILETNVLFRVSDGMSRWYSVSAYPACLERIQFHKDGLARFHYRNPLIPPRIVSLVKFSIDVHVCVYLNEI